MPLEFLRSRACAELSPLGAKLLLDILALLGPNCVGNGDIAITPSTMAVRGWTSRASLAAATRELMDHGLLTVTRQGSRLACSLFAITLFPLDARDPGKLEVGPGSYRTTDWMGEAGSSGAPPTEERPATWRRARGN